MRQPAVTLVLLTLCGCRSTPVVEGPDPFGAERIAAVHEAVDGATPPEWRVLDARGCVPTWEQHSRSTKQIMVSLVKKGEFYANSAHSVFFLLSRSYRPNELMLSRTGGPVIRTRSYQVYVWVWPYELGWKSFTADLAAALESLEPVEWVAARTKSGDTEPSPGAYSSKAADGLTGNAQE